MSKKVLSIRSGDPKRSEIPGLRSMDFTASAERRRNDGGEVTLRSDPKSRPQRSDFAWQFKPRFRRQAFGWKSQPAITRIKQAVTEIRKVARTDSALAADGAVLFLERLSPALERIDSSSGAIGTAVHNAIAELVPIIAAASIDIPTRAIWLDRLYEAYQSDDVPCIESLGDYWGELCAGKELASHWSDQLIAGIAALRWLAQGYGYEIKSLDIWAAYRSTVEAAEKAGCRDQVWTRIRELILAAPEDSFARSVLQRELQGS